MRCFSKNEARKCESDCRWWDDTERVRCRDCGGVWAGLERHGYRQKCGGGVEKGGCLKHRPMVLDRGLSPCG